MIPPPIPVPKVKIIKFFFLQPRLASAIATHFSSFSITTLFLNRISKYFFKLKFLNGRLGGFLIIPFSRGPGLPTPIALTSFVIKEEIESAISFNKSVLFLGVFFLRYLRI